MRQFGYKASIVFLRLCWLESMASQVLFLVVNDWSGRLVCCYQNVMVWFWFNGLGISGLLRIILMVL